MKVISSKESIARAEQFVRGIYPTLAAPIVREVAVKIAKTLDKTLAAVEQRSPCLGRTSGSRLYRMRNAGKL